MRKSGVSPARPLSAYTRPVHQSPSPTRSSSSSRSTMHSEVSDHFSRPALDSSGRYVPDHLSYVESPAERNWDRRTRLDSVASPQKRWPFVVAKPDTAALSPAYTPLPKSPRRQKNTPRVNFVDDDHPVDIVLPPPRQPSPERKVTISLSDLIPPQPVCSSTSAGFQLRHSFSDSGGFSHRSSPLHGHSTDNGDGDAEDVDFGSVLEKMMSLQVTPSQFQVQHMRRLVAHAHKEVPDVLQRPSPSKTHRATTAAQARRAETGRAKAQKLREKEEHERRCREQVESGVLRGLYHSGMPDFYRGIVAGNASGHKKTPEAKHRTAHEPQQGNRNNDKPVEDHALKQQSQPCEAACADDQTPRSSNCQSSPLRPVETETSTVTEGNGMSPSIRDLPPPPAPFAAPLPPPPAPPKPASSTAPAPPPPPPPPPPVNVVHGSLEEKNSGNRARSSSIMSATGSVSSASSRPSSPAPGGTRTPTSRSRSQSVASPPRTPSPRQHLPHNSAVRTASPRQQRASSPVPPIVHSSIDGERSGQRSPVRQQVYVEPLQLPVKKDSSFNDSVDKISPQVSPRSQSPRMLSGRSQQSPRNDVSPKHSPRQISAPQAPAVTPSPPPPPPVRQESSDAVSQNEVSTEGKADDGLSAKERLRLRIEARRKQRDSVDVAQQPAEEAAPSPPHRAAPNPPSAVASTTAGDSELAQPSSRRSSADSAPGLVDGAGGDMRDEIRARIRSRINNRVGSSSAVSSQEDGTQGGAA